ncbi:MAG: DUF885 family protein [Planctomycetota bacterium]
MPGTILAALILLPVPPQATAQNTERASDLRDFLERYATDRSSLMRCYRIAMSPGRLARLRRFHEKWQASLRELDFESLDQDGRVEYVLFRNLLRRELRRIEHEAERNQEIHALVPFWKRIVELAEKRQRLETIDPARTAERLDELAKQVAGLRASLGAKPGPGEQASATTAVMRTVAKRAARKLAELRRTLSDWFGFYDGYDPLFSWWVRSPYAELERELRDYEALMRKRLVSRGEDNPVLGDPIGREALLAELACEMLPYTPEELLEIAEREFRWCEKQRLAASRELGFGEDWQKALEHVKTLHVAPGKQPELIRDLANEAIRFLEERELVTIPALCKETWRMDMMTPERQKMTPYFTGGETISVSFPTDAMAHRDKLMSLRGNNVHFSRATVHHELIPGHHLQGFMTARHRTWRRIFRTPFWGEGWALYWEMLLWDLGFPKSPENRIGMLFWRSHRCARIIFSLSFHLEKMSAKEAIEFLIRRVGHERNNATAEVRRSVQGGYGPLYQAAYMLGGLQIRALHRELVGSCKMSNREFHDAVLRENSIPIEMIRAKLTGQKLTPDYESSWRFYDVGPADASGKKR